MPLSRKPSSRKTSRKCPPELVMAPSATPSPSAASHGTTDSEAIDLTAEVESIPINIAGPLIKLSCIWNNTHIDFCIVDGKNGWKCKWCGMVFKTRHSTRAMWHLLKIGGNGIATCKAIIPIDWLNQYMSLYQHNLGRLVSRKQVVANTFDHVVERQKDAVEALSKKRFTSLSYSTPVPLGSYQKKRRIRLGETPYNQPSIETAVD